MGFLQDFLEYNSGNECPKPYVIWTAYGLLSAAIGPRVYYELEIEHPPARIRCDTYIVLVGESGGRKTASMLSGLNILREAVPTVVLAGDNETYQSIITFLASEDSEREYISEDGKLAKYKPYHIFAEELMDYLQLNPIAMVTFLTNIYGKRFYKYRLKHEDNWIENPYVTLMACSVPAWLTDQLKSKQFTEGYGRRTILVCADPAPRRKPMMTEESIAAKGRCMKRLQELQGVVGRMTLEPEAERWFWEWYVSQKTPEDVFLRNWRSTFHINLLKVAMLSSLSERDDKVITLNYIKLALGQLEEVEKMLPMVTARMGRSEVNESALTILSTLRRAGGKMLEKQIKMATFKDFKNPMEQYSTFEFLRNTNQIYVVPEKVNGVERRMVVLPDMLRSKQ